MNPVITTYPPATNPRHIGSCGVCMEDFKEGDPISVLACHHIYNIPCAEKLQKCPACFTPIQREQEVPDLGLTSMLISHYIDPVIVVTPEIQLLRALKNARNWTLVNSRGGPTKELDKYATQLASTGIAYLQKKFPSPERPTHPKYLKVWKAWNCAITHLVFRYNPMYGTLLKKVAEKFHENPDPLSHIRLPFTKSDLKKMTSILQRIKKDLEWMDLQEKSLNLEELDTRAKQLARSLVNIEKIGMVAFSWIASIEIPSHFPTHTKPYVNAVLKEAAKMKENKH